MNGKFNFNNFLFYNFFLFVCECKLQKFTMTGSSNSEISVSLTFYHEQDNELVDFPKD
jgi:hypothetical protein